MRTRKIKTRWNLIKRIRIYLDLVDEVEEWLLSQESMKIANSTLELVFENWFEDAYAKSPNRSSFEPELRDIVQSHYGYLVMELIYDSFGKGLDIYRVRALTREKLLVVDINVNET